MTSLPVRLPARRTLALAAAALSGALAVTTAAVAPALATTPHPARHLDYVALGDSLASGPGVPDQVDANCLRSDHNYPSLIAKALRGTRLTDVSCSGASTAQMTAPQGTAGPQFDALNRGTDLVTITIGVNNVGVDGAGFTSIIGTCAKLGATDPAGSPCKDFFHKDGFDQLRKNIDDTAPKIAATLAGIHQRAPHAKVLVVGYPDLFPDDGSSCTSAEVPFAKGDFTFLRDANRSLNAMLAHQAGRGGARYVDTYRPTIGHDMCKPAGVRWIEPVVPPTPAAPAHPNARGQQALADAVLARR
ncbi:SGNH/GDSL hydrolase family protein [Streptomyces liangshanensis]|uniref:SGNH/GDSL hydrolase family protein n=1 Tax=Streptomyces liangshanensis TaxID=2717324 RepID=A0A6G9GY48_9ACTN|nr:SGNH/GDSL hydrolase family protein [Streptomyces liangshanensis]QIQ03198.1 SGNH/GDSL hydrolase family protein [Streptomyces liangshanensis]